VRKKRRILLHDLKVLRWTGAFGVAAGVLLLVASPLYVVLGTPPPLGDEALFSAYVTRNNTILITTKLVDMVYLVGFIVFVSGLRHLILRVRPDDEWLAALVFGSALVQTASVLMFEALAGGAALDTFNKPDPTVVRALTEASLAITDFSFILTALFLAAVSYAILATRALPRWTGWVGFGIAVLNLVAVPAIFGGNDFMEAVVAGVTTSAGLYAYVSDVMGLAYIGWLISVGISMMRVKPEAVVSATAYGG
jgi:hypothetical protein